MMLSVISYAYWYPNVFLHEMLICIFQWVFNVLIVELYTTLPFCICISTSASISNSV